MKRLCDMVTNTKNWVKDNLMSIVIAAMITAFWVDYQGDKQEELKFKKDMQMEMNSQDAKLRTVITVLIADPQTDEYSRQLLIDYLKDNRRGVTIN